jgi:hypothetical protein
MKLHRLACVVLFLCLVPLALSQTPTTVEGRLLQDLKFLTSDACEGRGILTKGINLASEYIEREFIKAGLKPGGSKGSYYQPFVVTTSAKPGPKNRLILKGPLGQTIALEHGRDFSVLPVGGSGQVEAPIVFAGYGITSTEPAYDDYAGLDVAGKVVVLISGTPRLGHPAANVFLASGNKNLTWPFTLRHQLENAQKHKAAAFLILNARVPGFPPMDLLPRPVYSQFVHGEPTRLPCAFVKRDLADAMLVSATGSGLAQFEQRIDAELKPRSTPLPGWTCTLETDVSFNQVPVKNIIGVLEGSGPLAKETVVIGAHYDHVGYYGSTRPVSKAAMGVSGPGSIGGVGFPLALLGEPGIHHGADDNASGTSVLMEVARRIGARKDRQGRRIVFIAFSAEESGLLGSAYYCRHPVFPLEDTAVMINMDQIGRLQENKLLVGGLGSAKLFSPLIDKLNAKHRFNLVKDISGPAPSDQSSFYYKHIPVLWFFTGFHEQYHRPTDRWETLNIKGLGRIAALVEDAILELAGSPTRPEFNKAPNFDRTKTLWATAPSTGIVPNFGDTREGLLLADVFKNTAGARAGLKPGDRILSAGGKKIPNPQAFLILARTLKGGEKIDLLVERAGKQQEVTLVLVTPPNGFTDPFSGFVASLTDYKGGMLVVGVLEKSPAARAGLKKGDRILSIAGKPMLDRDSYFAVLRTVNPGDRIPIMIQRGATQHVFQVQTVKGEAKKPSGILPGRKPPSSSHRENDMRKNGITFAELQQLLQRLGFCEISSQQGKPLRFEHPETGTVLLFRPHGAREKVEVREMVVVRRQLVDNGLIEGSAFDQFLQKASA